MKIYYCRNMEPYRICDWVTHEVIEEFWTEEERDDWMEYNCEWFSDGCYIRETMTKVYCERL